MSFVPQPALVVAVIGFGNTERKVIFSIFRISERRALRYVAQEAAADLAEPDVYLVDSDDPQAVSQWRSANSRSRILTLFAGQGLVAGTTPVVPRPLQGARLLRALDVAVRKAGLVRGDAATRDAVLIAGSPLTVTESLRSRLESLGCAVDAANDAGQAVQLTREALYALVFIDIGIANADAYQLCRRVKADVAEEEAPRVVILARADAPFDKLRGAMSACDAHLPVPYEEARLDALIARFFPDWLLRAKAQAGAGAVP